MKQLNKLLKLMSDDEFLGLPKIIEMQSKAVPLLQKILMDSQQANFIHQRALICLGEIGAAEGFDTASSYLSSPDPVFRIAAARAIVKIHPDKAADLLMDNLDDEDVSACNIKIQCLAASGQTKAKPALSKLKRTCKDPFIRKSASLAVKHLSQEGQT
jgi:HEAT repeat protein